LVEWGVGRRVVCVATLLAVACGGTTQRAETVTAPAGEQVDQDVVREMAWYSLATGYLAVGEPDRARQASLELLRAQLSRAHRIPPDGYVLMGDAYAAEGDWLTAHRFWEEARRIDPDDPAIQARLDRAHSELGDLVHNDPEPRLRAHSTDLCAHFPGCED